MNTTWSVGNILATGFRIWLRNLVPFLVITAVFYALPFFWAWDLARAEPSTENFERGVRALVAAAYLTIPINIFVSATLTYGVIMELHGQRASFGACIATGLGRIFPAFAVGVLTWVCIIAACFLFLIPGLIVMCMLYVTTQIAVLERQGVFGAISRSSALTSGHKMQIFSVVLLMLAVSFVSLMGLRQLVTPGTTPQGVMDALTWLIYLDFVHSVVMGSLNAVMASVMYYFLRADKEGTSSAELAAIFA